MFIVYMLKDFSKKNVSIEFLPFAAIPAKFVNPMLARERVMPYISAMQCYEKYKKKWGKPQKRCFIMLLKKTKGWVLSFESEGKMKITIFMDFVSSF